MGRFINRKKDPSKNDKSLFDYGMNLVDDGRARRKIHEAQWYEDIATYCGDLWSEFDVTLNKLTEPARPKDRVRLPVNLAQPMVRTEYSKLLKNRPMTDCLARSDTRADLNSAKVGDSVLNNYVEFELQMGRVRRQMLQWVLICGMGGIFVDLDPSALGDQEVLIAPDGSPVTDPQMINAIKRHYRDRKKAPKTAPMPLGELRNVALSPFQLIYDFSKLDFNQAKWCIVSEVFDVDEVYKRWGVEVDGDKNPKPGVMDRRLIEKWDITSKPIIEWSRGDTQRMVEIHRLFFEPGHRYFPDGLEMVFTDNELIEHTNFPWKHRWLPVGVAGHVPAPWSQHTMSVVRQVKPLILEISKTESQMIENRNLMGNPPWIEYIESQVQGAIVNRPGLRIRINYMPNVPEPHPVEMPEISQYIKDLIPILKEHVLEISGQSEVSQGKVPAGARAGVTIAYLQEEDDTKLGPTVLEYEECMERVSWLQLQTIAQEYDIPRTVRIYKPHGEPEVFDFMGTMLTGIAGVRVQAGSALPRSKAAKQQFVLDLWDRRLEQDPRKVRDMLELSQGEPDEWEKDVNQAERENRKMQLGQTVEVKEWHNHPAHHYQHRDYMKSPEYEELPPEIRQIFEDHDEAHSAAERQQQQEVMAQQALAGGGGPPAGPGQPPQNGGGGANGVTATPGPQQSPQPNGAPGTNPEPQDSSGQAVAFGQPQ
jgi:hypothetical protein